MRRPSNRRGGLDLHRANQHVAQRRRVDWLRRRARLLKAFRLPSFGDMT